MDLFAILIKYSYKSGQLYRLIVEWKRWVELRVVFCVDTGLDGWVAG